MKPPAQPRAYRRRAYDQLGVLLPRPATRRELTRDTLGLLTTLLSLAGGAVGAVALLVAFGVIRGATQ